MDKCLEDVGRKQGSSKTTLSNTKPKNWINVSRGSLPKFAKVMALTALDRHLKQNDSKISIAKDRECVKCRQVLDGKARALREKGYGKRPNATKALTMQDEEQLWKNRILGEHNPKSLLSYTLWYLLTLRFGLRGCQEHHEMFVEDFTLNKDDEGTEYITFEENPTKTRQGGLRKKRRAIQPKMFATGGPRCPVLFFKTYLAYRPEELRNSGLFYLAIIEKPKSEVWYKKKRMGVNKIRLLHEKYGLKSRIGCREKEVNQPLGKKNACEEAEGFKSAKKCYHRCNRSHKRAFTDRLRGRLRSRTATDLIHNQLSCQPTNSNFQFFPVCPFSRTIQNAKQ